jgi:hypothetical protein
LLLLLLLQLRLVAVGRVVHDELERVGQRARSAIFVVGGHIVRRVRNKGGFGAGVDQRAIDGVEQQLLLELLREGLVRGLLLRQKLLLQLL